MTGDVVAYGIYSAPSISTLAPLADKESSNKVVAEDKLPLGIRLVERFIKPVILGFTKGPVPDITTAGVLTSAEVRFPNRVPERIDYNKECITPLPHITVFAKTAAMGAVGIA